MDTPYLGARKHTAKRKREDRNPRTDGGLGYQVSSVGILTPVPSARSGPVGTWQGTGREGPPPVLRLLRQTSRTRHPAIGETPDLTGRRGEEDLRGSWTVRWESVARATAGAVGVGPSLSGPGSAAPPRPRRRTRRRRLAPTGQLGRPLPRVAPGRAGRRTRTLGARPPLRVGPVADTGVVTSRDGPVRRRNSREPTREGVVAIGPDARAPLPGPVAEDAVAPVRVGRRAGLVVTPRRPGGVQGPDDVLARGDGDPRPGPEGRQSEGAPAPPPPTGPPPGPEEAHESPVDRRRLPAGEGHHAEPDLTVAVPRLPPAVVRTRRDGVAEKGTGPDRRQPARDPTRPRVHRFPEDPADLRRRPRRRPRPDVCGTLEFLLLETGVPTLGARQETGRGVQIVRLGRQTREVGRPGQNGRRPPDTGSKGAGADATRGRRPPLSLLVTGLPRPPPRPRHMPVPVEVPKAVPRPTVPTGIQPPRLSTDGPITVEGQGPGGTGGPRG